MRGVIPLALGALILLGLAAFVLLGRGGAPVGGGLGGGAAEGGPQADDGEKPPLPALKPGDGREPEPAGVAATPATRATDDGEAGDKGAPAPQHALVLEVRDTAGNLLDMLGVLYTAVSERRGPDGALLGRDFGPGRLGITSNGVVGWPLADGLAAAHERGVRTEFRLQIDTPGWAITGTTRVAFPPPPTPVRVTLTRLPELRVQIISAADGSPVEEVECEGAQVLEDGEWWRLFAAAGRTAVRVSAPGFVPATATLVFPPAGVNTHPTPVRLNPGYLLSGYCSNGGPKGPMLEAFVVVEATGGDGGVFRSAPTPLRFEFTLPPGTYRLLAFSRGYAPHMESIDLQADREGLRPVLLPLGTEDPPAALPYRWSERRALPIPIAIKNLPASEIVDWIQAIAGTPIRVEADARDKLAKVQASAAFQGVPVESALKLVAMLAGLEFDADTATLSVPH